jgi:hypothetical protein
MPQSRHKALRNALRVLPSDKVSSNHLQHGISATTMHSTETLMSLHQLSSWAIGAPRRDHNRSGSIEEISVEEFHRSTSAHGVNGQAPVAIMQSTVNENTHGKVTRVSAAWCIGPTNFAFPPD